MKLMKRNMTALVALFMVSAGAWAQAEEVTVTPAANANEWTLTMPASDIELQVEYYTDEEVAEMEREAAFTEGVELAKNPDGTWSLASMPAFDVELQVEYYTELQEGVENDYTAISGTADIWLGRTLQAGGYNTFAVPFAIPAGKFADYNLTAVKKLTASSFDSKTGELSLTFADETEGIEAGKPYLVKVSANVENPTFDGVAVSGTAEPVSTASVDFIPTLGATTLVGDVKSLLFLGGSNRLYHPDRENASMKGFRAYFLLKGEALANARSFAIDFGDGMTTGIIEVTAPTGKAVDEGTYTLDGRRLSGEPVMKGVYIRNGKKVIVK